MAHVASMIAQGVFEKWPDLYCVVIECGEAGVPHRGEIQGACRYLEDLQPKRVEAKHSW